MKRMCFTTATQVAKQAQVVRQEPVRGPACVKQMHLRQCKRLVI